MGRGQGFAQPAKPAQIVVNDSGGRHAGRQSQDLLQCLREVSVVQILLVTLVLVIVSRLGAGAAPTM